MALSPARNAVAAPRSGPVSLTFTQAITVASAPNLKVFGSQLRGKRPGVVSGGGTATLRFAPTQAFAPGERVSVSVPVALTNAGGTGAVRQVYQFTAATGGTGRGFFLDTTEVAYTNSRDQLLGDIDNDGDLDLLTSGGLFGMYAYRNNGAGRFTAFRNAVVGNTPSGATLADVNGDGALDLLAGDADNATVAIGLNDGTGIFQDFARPMQLLPVGTRPVAVTAGDVDGDGDLDLVSANATAGTVSLGFNNGAGLFGGTLTLAVGSQPSAVQLGDIDNDGDLDLLTTSKAGNYVNVRLNNGLGSFAGSTNVGTGAGPTDFALADIDADGDLDLLVANGVDGTVSVRPNNGLGLFGATTSLNLPAASTPTGLSTGDVDGDGDLDLVVAQGTGGQVITYLNNGSGIFGMQYASLELSATTLGAPVSLGVALGDVDGDGDLDIITTEDGTKRVVLGRDGTAPPVAAPVLTGFSPGAGPVGTRVVVAGTSLGSTSAVRFNGLTASFLVSSNQQLTATVPAGAGTGPIAVTTVSGTAATAQSFVVTSGVVPPVNVVSTTPPGNAVSVSATAAVRVTFDAPISGASAPGLRVFGSQRRGRHTGPVSGGGTATLSLVPTPAFAPGEEVSLSVPAALTGTGGGSVRPRVVAFRAATGGTGQGVFGATGSASSALAAATRDLQAVDLDNDGDLDAVGMVANPANPTSTASVLVRLNNGNGTFSPGAPLPVVNGPFNLLLPADVDGDGDLDLLATSYTTPSNTTVNVWLNDGSGQFTAGPAYNNPNYVYRMRAGDVDGDGDLDLVVAEPASSANLVRVVLNNGTGSFSSTLAAVSVPRPSGAGLDLNELADLDNDGDLDATVFSNSVMTALLNDGQGQLTPQASQNFFGAQQYFLGSSVRDAHLADLTGDGLPDLVLLGNSRSGSSPLAVVAGLGNGRFEDVSVVYQIANSPDKLWVGDLNADARLDVVMVSPNPAGLDVRLGDGLGMLYRPDYQPLAAAGETLGGAALADFDGDGDLDVLYNNVTTAALLVRFNQGRPAPTLAALAPAQGPVGARVVLTGTNLGSVRRVTFGGVAALRVLPLSDTQCAATVPPGARTGPVTATTPAGTATSPGSFTVLATMLPNTYLPARNAPNVPRTATVRVTLPQPAGAVGNLVLNSEQRQGRRTGTASGASTAGRSFDPALDFAPGEKVQVSLPGGPGAALPQVYGFVAAANGPGQANMVRDSYTTLSGFETTTDIVGDFDEDGAPDLISCGPAGFSQELRVLFNDGRGRFGARVLAMPSTIVRSVRAADLNGDGHLDLVVSVYHTTVLPTNLEIDRVVWLPGTGTGAFGSEQVLHIASGGVASLAVGDLNGDGAPDLAGLLVGTDSVLVSLNDGAGGFRRRPNAIIERGASSLQLADLDNDGALDLLAVGAYPFVSRSFGTGAGDFVPSPALPLSEPGYLVEVGDVTGDGNLDLITSTSANVYQGTVQVRPGDGTGNFGYGQPVGGNIAAARLRLADFDGDGDLDLLTANAITATGGRIFFNNGTGSFAAPRNLTFAHFPRQLLVADLDLDGSLDVGMTGDSSVSGGNSRWGIVVYLNRPTPPTITTFAPLNGPPGTVVTLTGTNLGGVTSVTIGGVAVAFTVVSNTQITLTTTPGIATGPIVLTAPYGSVGSTGIFVVPAPTIVSFTPTSGAVQRQVTLTGTYFGGTTAVRFGGVNAPGFVVSGGTQLTVPVPAGALSGRITLVTPSGTATSAGVFAVVPNPQLLSLNPARNSLTALVAGPVGLAYSLPMDAAAASGLRVFGNQRQGRRTGALGGSGTATLGFTPTQPFAAGEEVSVSVPAGLPDANGNPVLAGQVFQFRAATSGPGRGIFAPGAVLPQTDVVYQVLTGDLNGDGYLDLFTRERGQTGAALVMARVSLNNGAGGYGPPTPLALGGIDYSNFKLADIDNDSDLDLLTLRNGTPGAVCSFLNNGQGQFAAGSPLTSFGDGASDWAVGDVNADGNLDVLLNTYIQAPGQVLVCLGDGQGGLGAATAAASVPDFPLRLTLGDVDNDGDLDLVTNDARTASVRLNDGRGQFTGTQDIDFSNFGVRAVVLADFDGDGDLDLLAPSTGWGMALKANDGSGQFGTDLGSLGGAYTGAIAVGDVDADGDLDVFVGASGAFSGTQAWLQLNRGGGAFSTVLVPMGTSQLDVALGDTDNDGDLDLIASLGMTVTVRPNGPARPEVLLTAQAPARNSNAASPGAPIDLTFSQPIGTATANGWAVYGNQRQGRRTGTYGGGGTAALRFVPAQPFAPGEQVSVSVPASLAGAGPGTGQVRAAVYQFTAATAGTGVGVFAPPTAVPATLFLAGNTAQATTVADVNGDGVPDLLSLVYLTNTTSALDVRLGSPAGRAAFGAPSRLPIGAAAVMTVGDVDGDGDLDLVVAARTAQSLGAPQVLTNSGTGTFTARLIYIGSGVQHALRLADMDADGDLDLIVSSLQSLDIYFNDGLGDFQAQNPFRVQQYQRNVFGLAVGDLDQDGALDLAYVSASGSYVTLWYNYNNTPALSPLEYDISLPNSGTASPQDVQLADMDADGDLDLVVVNRDQNRPGATALIYRNDGVQRFALARTIPVDDFATTLRIGDLDHDGDVDLAVLVPSTGAVNLRFNPGQLSQPFTLPAVPLNLGGPSFPQALVDLDRDGDLDLLTSTGPNLALYLNGGTVLGTAAAVARPGVPFDLFPNPGTAPGTVQVRADIGAQAATIHVFNVLGQEVLTQAVPAVQRGNVTLTLPQLVAGAYLVRFVTADGQQGNRTLVLE